VPEVMSLEDTQNWSDFNVIVEFVTR